MYSGANLVLAPRSTFKYPVPASRRGVEPFLPTQYEPENGAPPTERTEFRVAYDDTYLYLSLRAYESDSDGIRSNTLYRDRLSGDDHFEILIDTYNDNETGVLFTTTPAGIRRDAALTNDASGGGIAGGGWLNVDFNTYWDVATKVADRGWFAELRVPFSSLRFQQRDDDTVVIGIALQRKVARKTERLVFPSVRPIADFAFLKPSLAQKVMLRGIRPHLPVYVTPYALAGGGESAALNRGGTAFQHDREWSREIGGDLKYSISNNATLDLTVNTDFAQVEADDQQINLTRFSLFFPEKRQFFQERAGIFDFRTGGLSRLFHTLGVQGFAFLRNEDGSIESAEIGPQWEYAAKNGTGAVLEARLLYEDLPFSFSLSDNVVVPEGEYTFYRVGASYHETHTRLFQLRPEIQAGTFYDGWQVTAQLTPIWYVSPHLELAGSYQYSHIRFPDREVAMTSDSRLNAHLARLRIGTAVNTQIPTNLFVQYNSLLDVLSANVRFRYNLREGNDLWIVYNQGMNTDRYRFDPRLLLVDNQTILVKYTQNVSALIQSAGGTFGFI
jgi:hypothetical protein